MMNILYTLEGYILNVGNIKGVIAMAKNKEPYPAMHSIQNLMTLKAAH